MKIAVDCRMIDSSGIGVYLRGVLPYLLQSENNFLLIGNSKRFDLYVSNPKVEVIHCCIKPFSLKELFFFPSKISGQINKADLFFSPFFNIPANIKIPLYTTIHDIIFPDMSELTNKLALSARMWFFKRAYRKSVKIFTVSEFSKSRIEYYFGKTKPVIVTHSAVQNMFFEYRKKKLNIEKEKTIVFIGNIKKHKGLHLLIEAFCLARKEGLAHKLIIIGEKENFRSGDRNVIKKINSLNNDSVALTGLVSDEILMEYLSKASLLVHPSFYEGFGLPPLEALVLGTPALISDIPVFREIYNDFPVTFFRTGDCMDLKVNIIKLLKENLSLPDLSDELLHRYTFEKTASKILKEFE